MFLSRLLSWFIILGFAAIGALLLRAAWKRTPGSHAATADGSTRFLGVARLGFIALCLGVLGLHSYWAMFAAGPISEDPRYAKIKDVRDQRERRRNEATLRGWVYDRSRTADKALCRYTVVGGRVYRTYPLGPDGAHIIGYTSLVRGDAGIEKAFETKLTTPASKSVVTPSSVGSDIQLSIDYDLQRLAAAQLKNRRGAVAVVRISTGEILAMVSGPSFDPAAVNDDTRWQMLLDDKNRPLVNRAANEYYLPGSTFKIIVAAAALESGLQNQRFVSKPEGFTPPGSGRAIRDDEGEALGSLDLAQATEKSSNQYFAQMALLLGSQKLGDVAHRFGYRIEDSPEKAREARIAQNLWNTDGKELDAFGVAESRLVFGPRTSQFDIALQAIGQGFNQSTVLQMALVAAAIGHPQGKRLAPSIEAERPPKELGQALTPAAATALRPMLRAVVERGTAARAFAGCRVPVAGKTGTAQVGGGDRFRIDAWFVGYAPAENPQIAFAVMVEGAGYGGEKAAPVARAIVEQAERQGLIQVVPRRR
jgi:penicillin-binding protein A